MLALAKALMGRPRMIMPDEPSLGLAPTVVAEIFRIIQSLNEQGTTILLVEQNAREALRISRRAYVLDTGRIVLTGTGEDLLNNEEVKEGFPGQGLSRENGKGRGGEDAHIQPGRLRRWTARNFWSCRTKGSRSWSTRPTPTSISTAGNLMRPG